MRRTIKDNGPDPLDRYVGAMVRGRRRALRLSQTELGEAIGVTFQQVQKYENGTNRIGASNLYRIARHLGVEVTFFFDGIEQVDGVAPDQLARHLPTLHPRWVDDIVSISAQLPESIGKCLAQLVRSVVGADNSAASL